MVGMGADVSLWATTTQHGAPAVSGGVTGRSASLRGDQYFGPVLPRGPTAESIHSLLNILQSPPPATGSSSAMGSSAAAAAAAAMAAAAIAAAASRGDLGAAATQAQLPMPLPLPPVTVPGAHGLGAESSSRNRLPPSAHASAPPPAPEPTGMQATRATAYVASRGQPHQHGPTSNMPVGAGTMPLSRHANSGGLDSHSSTGSAGPGTTLKPLNKPNPSTAQKQPWQRRQEQQPLGPDGSPEGGGAGRQLGSTSSGAGEICPLCYRECEEHHRLGMFWRKFGYDGPPYCSRCSSVFRAHMVTRTVSEANCSRESPCIRCTNILNQFRVSHAGAFAAMDAARKPPPSEVCPPPLHFCWFAY
jgi:hypothetical protein